MCLDITHGQHLRECVLSQITGEAADHGIRIDLDGIRVDHTYGTVLYMTVVCIHYSALQRYNYILTSKYSMRKHDQQNVLVVVRQSRNNTQECLIWFIRLKTGNIEIISVKTITQPTNSDKLTVKHSH